MPIGLKRVCTGVLAVFCFAGIGGVLTGRAHAQSEQEDDTVATILPAGSRAVITRLDAFHELPDGAWKMHAGDVPHGEAVNLDDSGWKAVKAGDKAPADAVWLRQAYTIPETLRGYDLTGARIWFQYHFGTKGPKQQIIYFNGRRVAMGDDMEPVVLFEGARPGERITVAVKLLQTADVKTLRGATLKIDFPENRPNPEDLREEFLAAALLVPSLARTDASQMETLNSAITAVDLKALDAHDQAAFDASLKTSHAKLEALLPLVQTMTWHVTGNSHIDAAWRWPWTETVDVVKRTFGTALQLMYEYPQYTYTQSAAAYNEWMAEKYPDINAEIKRRVQDGRWEIVGGMWIEPDLNMPDGESLVRQLLVGKRWFRQAYGVDVRVGWNPDSFGYSWQLPQIYKKSGMDYFVTQKMDWNDTNKLPFKLFWWESPDGSKVLTYFPQDYDNNDLNPSRLAENTAQARGYAPGLTEMMDLYGVGDHGGGPTRTLLDEGLHWSTPSTPPKVLPKMQFGTAQAFFSSVEKQIAPESPEWNYQSIARGYSAPPAVEGKVSIPTWKSEMYLEFHRGVTTTQANQKKNMRESEEQVLNAEKWASLAWLDGRAYPAQELTEDWKKVLFNQFHDTAAGSGIGVVYKDAQKDYDVVRWSTNEITAGSLAELAERIQTEAQHSTGTPVVVWNPLGWQRTGAVIVKVQGPSSMVKSWKWRAGEIADDTRPAHVVSADAQTGVMTLSIPNVRVPALGYTVLHLLPVDTPAEQTGSKPTSDGNSYTLENAHLRVSVDRTSGCINSLVEKKTGFDTLAAGACGDQLQFFKDTPKRNDAWNIDPGTLDAAPATVDKADAVEAVTAADGSPAVRVTKHYQNSKLVQTIALAEEADMVDIDNEIDWHEAHVLLKAAFPLAASGPFATYEIPYGTIDRPSTRNNSWEKAQFEVPAMRWADLGDGRHGLSILNQTKYGYDAAGNTLRISLLRSPKEPDPEADMGHHHFHYALYPHAGTWKDAMTVRHGWEYNYPLTAMVATAHAGALPEEHSFASVAPENVVLTAVKKAEDANGLIFRAYEWAGRAAFVEFHVPESAISATVTNLQETPEGAPLEVHGSVVKARIKPYEILTIRVDYAHVGSKQ